MGGDGGVIASNRRYMRGAGSASCTADAVRYVGDASRSNADPAVIELEILRSMRYCALTDKPLMFNTCSKNNITNDNSGVATIVVCPYGRLYNKEAAVEALLQRHHEQSEPINEEDPSQRNKIGGTDDVIQNGFTLGDHIHGLKYLYDARFETMTHDGETVPICPVTRRELNGRIAAFCLVPKKRNSKANIDKRDSTISCINNSLKWRVNVVSEKAIQQMGLGSILTEYGPTTVPEDVDLIRICPPPDELNVIQNELQLKRQDKEVRNKKKKKRDENKKNRRHDGTTVVENDNKEEKESTLKKLKQAL